MSHFSAHPHAASGTVEATPRWWPTAAYAFTARSHWTPSCLSIPCLILPFIASRSSWRPPLTLSSCSPCRLMSSSSGWQLSKIITPSPACCPPCSTSSLLYGSPTYYAPPALVADAGSASSPVATTAECAGRGCAILAAKTGWI